MVCMILIILICSLLAVDLYGRRVTFACDACYSHRYALPDANGEHHMYYAQVLTGEFTVGVTSMLVPPPKDSLVDPNTLYDSTVDKLSNPSIFVVYNHFQHYPTYLINYI